MRRQYGVTLLELLVAVVVMSILTMIAIPMFTGPGIECKNPGEKARIKYTERARVAAAIGLLGEINIKVDMFDLNHNRIPTSLDEIDVSTTVDPWGNPYIFLNFTDVEGNGPKRKDHNMVPVNSYFDVYSMGPDGKTATPFTSIPGGDDIVIANNGQYVGVACEYYGNN